MGDATITLPGWVVAILMAAVPTLLVAIAGLVLDRIKEQRYRALIEDLRADYIAADTKERHDMRNELLPHQLAAGLQRLSWNQFLAMKHPELLHQFTVKEPET